MGINNKMEEEDYLKQIEGRWRGSNKVVRNSALVVQSSFGPVWACLV